jgi:tryptophan synthase alpha chain
MSRIDATFARLRAEGRAALVPYVCAGDPSKEGTAAVLHGLVRGGADVLELGIPFSDPMADGPVIQRASERALARGTRLADVLAAVRDFRRDDATTPVVLMGYANPIERHGVQRFVDGAADAGVDGTIVVDYPPEECGAFVEALASRGMDPVFLVAPTSTPERIAALAGVARGYVYQVSLTGVTGAATIDPAAVAVLVERLRAAVKVPVGVGFGIRDAATAKAVARVADAVVVGTALVQALHDAVERDGPGAAPAAGEAFVAAFRAAMDEDRRIAA